MDDLKFKALSDPTRLKILCLLSDTPMTNTELYKVFNQEGMQYRESVFRALKRLREAKLIRRRFHEKVGYKYKLNFERLELGGRLVLDRL